ncbi:CocE/NonD family hydrolase [Paenibacillus spongiae]|uniref:CocE/NonD family hydrolase n=1 Tax=Paenibacillus spongiae TaxID=2909671 RepID=A0ABY5S5Y1_9BACL|nr:CocE/NonD family hydrolase [Paenibacillus spongiae]UVI29319.1 CocE/NonD family hydrolase [Paenibacillus spongiae]
MAERFGDVILERDRSCIMRDGTVLYADIYRPEAEGPHPVLLMRQPYGKRIASTVTYAHPVWYAKQGYIVVIQDVRGRGISEGEFEPFIREAEDGWDTVEWAAGLPDSNGRVGMYGFSYQGFTQWAAASEKPPRLAAIAPGMCGADVYGGMIYPQGRLAIWEHLPWAYQLARDAARRAGDPSVEEACTSVRRGPSHEMLLHLPVAGEHPILSRYFPAYREWCSHPHYDEYWESRNLMPKLADSPVPALHIGGWYDLFLMGTMRMFDAIGRGNPTHRLIVGPWDHIPWGRRAGGVDHGAEACGDIHLKQLRWFDYWLKDKGDAGSPEAPAIEYFELGGNRWRSLERGVSPFGSGLEAERRFLRGSAVPANGASGGGRLADAAAGADEGSVDVFVYDSRLPMPLDSYLPQDRSEIEDRFEMLVFTSEPAERCFRVFGAPRVRLQVQADDGPTDLIAVLSAVYPDGASRFLSVGREEIGKGESGEWETVEIELRPVAMAFDAGLSVRLELTGSAFPVFVRHPGGVPPEDIHRVGPERLNVVSVAVKSGGAVSYLELPVVADGG